MTTVMMKCGHASNSTLDRLNGKDLDPPIPACVICFTEANAFSYTPVDEPPDLTGRLSRCGSMCHKLTPSSLDLAFFEYRPDREYDTHYDGCRGWD